MNDIRLELPDIKYKESYLSAIKEYHNLDSEREEDRYYDRFTEKMIDEEFVKTVVQPKLNAIEGVGLKPGYVPSTEYWIIDETGFAGRITFRHFINERLRSRGGHIGYAVVPSKRGRHYALKALKKLLAVADRKGLSQVLITCDDDNIPSKKTIIKVLREYGGKEDNPFMMNEEIINLRFWINTSKQD